MDSRNHKPIRVWVIFLIMVLLTVAAFLTIGALSGGPILEFTAIRP